MSDGRDIRQNLLSRKDQILILLRRPKPLTKIRRALSPSVGPSTALRILSDLHFSGLVDHIEGQFTLTDQGRIRRAML